MSPIARIDVESSLQKKGFKREETDHAKFVYIYNGKQTSIWTKTSRGTGHRDISDDLLNSMKREMKLDKLSDAKRFFNCPMEREEYLSILRSKGFCLS
jgi:hypothetical protein